MINYIGKQIDRYQVTEQLGQGGMAVVYKAYDTRLQRDVAIKLIRTEAIPQEQHGRLMKRFEREAQSQARFSHPNIVAVYDYGEVDGLPYLVMELITGETLKEIIGTPIDYKTAIAWVKPIAEALAYAHQYGVVHRDIKPSNILIKDGRPILADFGVAKVLETEDLSLTGTGLGVGTPEYMAPEQWQGKSGSASDQYALGVVLYELLTGNKPYTAETPVAVALKQMNEPLRRPSKWVPAIPEVIEKCLYKALARDPQDRFETMADFSRILDQISRMPLAVQNHPEIEKADQPFASSTDLIRSEAETVDIFDVESQNQAAVSRDHRRLVLPKWMIWGAAGTLIVCFLVVSAFLILGGVNLLQATDADNRADKEPTGLGDELSVLRITEAIATGETIELTATSELTLMPTSEPTLGIGSMLTRETDQALMMYVPAGNFLMGSLNNDPEASSHEKPQREVFLDAYWIDAFEVSNAMFTYFVSNTGYQTLAERQGFSYMYDSSWQWTPVSDVNWRSPMGPGTFSDDSLPVVHVSYDDAMAYCRWVGGRLPTEGEWEKAARGDDGRIFPWGNTFNSDYLRSNASNGPVSIDLFSQGVSPYGIYNMAGNAFEWTNDWYRPDYYSISSGDNPTGPSAGEFRVIRGGSWNNSQLNVRTAHRDVSMPNYMNHLLGFRCAMDEE